MVALHEYCTDPRPPLVNRGRLKKVPELKIVWREDWGALEPLEKPKLEIPVTTVLLTYTETRPCTDDESCLRSVRDLQGRQIAEGAVDIHWNFLVGGNGKVYEGRGWDVRAQKAPEYAELDGHSFDIAYIARSRGERTEEMKFIKGQLIRFALMEWLIKDPFDFVEDKVDMTDFVKKRKEYERNELLKRKERRAKKRQKMEEATSKFANVNPCLQ